jgi:hypothetical protein
MRENTQDLARVVDVVFLDVEREDGLLQPQELSGAAGGDDPEDRLDRGGGLLVEALGRVHGGDALAQSGWRLSFFASTIARARSQIGVTRQYA